LRRRDVDRDKAIVALGADGVDIRGTHVRPQLRDVVRHSLLQPNVIGLVVARPVAGGEHRREFVERQLAIGHRIAIGAVGVQQF